MDGTNLESFHYCSAICGNFPIARMPEESRFRETAVGTISAHQVWDYKFKFYGSSDIKSIDVYR